MAKNGLTIGGTPGATLPADPLADRLAIQFHFDDETRDRLLGICPPCDEWMEQYRQGGIELVATPEAALTMTLEGCANRFLRNKVKPAGKASQRRYLQLIESHAEALMQLLTAYQEVDGTIADPFRFLEKVSRTRGDDRSRFEHWSRTQEVLMMLRLFATFRLHRDLAPEPDEKAEEDIKRRTEYPRFVLIADLLAAFRRITGGEPTAHATKDRFGNRQASPAVDFLSVALPPILKAARLKTHVIDDQVLRKEVADVKRLWAEGKRPELAYIFPDWGGRVG